MRLLLDTHVLLWWLDGDRRLGAVAASRIEDDATDVYVSAATAWEIAVKRAAGKLAASFDVSAEIDDEGFLPLAITVEHGVAAGGLPLHHTDPFDRMLVAQACTEGLWLVTSDAAIRQYDVPLIDAAV